MHIDLPELPRSWDQLTAEQMTRLNVIRRQAAGGMEEYLFRAFCYLLDIELVQGGVVKDDDGLAYRFRCTGGGCEGQEFCLQGWQVQWFIGEKLEWLGKDCDRLADVFPTVRLGGRTFSSPGYAMACMTYQQHQTAQRCLGAYYTATRRLLEMTVPCGGDDARKRAQAERLLEERERMRRMFLSAVFTPECKVSVREVDGTQIVYDPPTCAFVFTTAQVEKNADLFAAFPEEKSDAVMQHFNGVMMYYRRIFPLLFGEGDGGSQDFIQIEQSTMNMLQEKLHLTYQQIYDSNAPFILGKLNDIIKEAKEIERLNARMKLKK